MTSLGIPHLNMLWSRTATDCKTSPIDWQADQITLHGLGIGLPDALQFLLQKRPSFTEFEAWILAWNGGDLDKERLAAINAAVQRAKERAPKSAIADDFSPVFESDEMRHWDDNGYIVLKNAISTSAAAAAGAAICEHIGVELARPDTWYTGAKSEGIFVSLTRHPAFDANRASPRIRSAFAQLLATDDLVMNIDRGGFNPPERLGWRFRGQGLHWDISIAPPVQLRIQGLLYLNDTPADQGAFQCVPGFHKRLDAWVAALPDGARPREQDLSADAIPVPGKAGDMVLWHAALPHGATPNRGMAPRLVQYIAYYSVTAIDERPWL